MASYLVKFPENYKLPAGNILIAEGSTIQDAISKTARETGVPAAVISAEAVSEKTANEIYGTLPGLSGSGRADINPLKYQPNPNYSDVTYNPLTWLNNLLSTEPKYILEPTKPTTSYFQTATYDSPFSLAGVGEEQFFKNKTSPSVYTSSGETDGYASLGVGDGGDGSMTGDGGGDGSLPGDGGGDGNTEYPDISTAGPINWNLILPNVTKDISGRVDIASLIAMVESAGIPLFYKKQTFTGEFEYNPATGQYDGKPIMAVELVENPQLTTIKNYYAAGNESIDQRILAAANQSDLIALELIKSNALVDAEIATADSAKEVAEINAKAQEKVAEIQADAQRRAAELEAALGLRVAETQAGASLGVAKEQAAATLGAAPYSTTSPFGALAVGLATGATTNQDIIDLAGTLARNGLSPDQALQVAASAINSPFGALSNVENGYTLENIQSILRGGLTPSQASQQALAATGGPFGALGLLGSTPTFENIATLTRGGLTAEQLLSQARNGLSSDAYIALQNSLARGGLSAQEQYDLQTALARGGLSAQEQYNLQTALSRGGLTADERLAEARVAALPGVLQASPQTLGGLSAVLGQQNLQNLLTPFVGQNNIAEMPTTNTLSSYVTPTAGAYERMSPFQQGATQASIGASGQNLEQAIAGVTPGTSTSKGTLAAQLV